MMLTAEMIRDVILKSIKLEYVDDVVPRFEGATEAAAEILALHEQALDEAKSDEAESVYSHCREHGYEG